jgi:hypothetical protein
MLANTAATCGKGFFFDPAGKCVKCHASAAACNGPGRTRSLECNAALNFELIQGRCICKKGFYLGSDEKCLQCEDEGCGQCNGPGLNTCFKCLNSGDMIHIGKCYSCTKSPEKFKELCEDKTVKFDLKGKGPNKESTPNPTTVPDEQIKKGFGAPARNPGVNTLRLSMPEKFDKFSKDFEKETEEIFKKMFKVDIKDYKEKEHFEVNFKYNKEAKSVEVDIKFKVDTKETTCDILVNDAGALREKEDPLKKLEDNSSKPWDGKYAAAQSEIPYEDEMKEIYNKYASSYPLNIEESDKLEQKYI